MILYFFFHHRIFLDGICFLLLLNRIIMHFLCSSTFIALNQQEHSDKIDKASKTVHTIKIKDQYSFYFIDNLNLRKK